MSTRDRNPASAPIPNQESTQRSITKTATSPRIKGNNASFTPPAPGAARAGIEAPRASAASAHNFPQRNRADGARELNPLWESAHHTHVYGPSTSRLAPRQITRRSPPKRE